MVPNLHSSAIDYGQSRPRSKKRVTAQHTLERVRNNQRRHRAQKREYTAMLEVKLTHAEQQVNALKAELARYQEQDASRSLLGPQDQRDGPPAPQPSPKSVDTHTLCSHVNTKGRGTVTHSHPHLLQLLPHSSLRGPELVDAASHAASDDIYGRDHLTTASYPDHLTGTATAAVSESSGAAEFSCCSWNMPGVAAHRESQRVGVSRPWLSATVDFHSNLAAAGCCYSSSHALQLENLAISDHDYGSSLGRPSLPGSAPRSPIEASGQATENESTMPCAEAYILIEQQNFKGVHQKDVASWLWTGFRSSSNPGEGCRVKTDLLFSLLTFISET